MKNSILLKFGENVHVGDIEPDERCVSPVNIVALSTRLGCHAAGLLKDRAWANKSLSNGSMEWYSMPLGKTMLKVDMEQ